MLFVGCLMLGMGIGFLFEEVPAGLFIGLGVGFILEGLMGQMKSVFRSRYRQDQP